MSKFLKLNGSFVGTLFLILSIQPLDTGRELNVHEMLERLFNVPCIFN